MSQKAPLWVLQLHLFAIVLISLLPQLQIAQLPKEDLPHLGGVGDMCVDPVSAPLTLFPLQALDQKAAQALPPVPAADHQSADPPDAGPTLAFSEDTTEDVPLAVRHPHLPRCLLPLRGDLLC